MWQAWVFCMLRKDRGNWSPIIPPILTDLAVTKGYMCQVSVFFSGKLAFLHHVCFIYQVLKLQIGFVRVKVFRRVLLQRVSIMSIFFRLSFFLLISLRSETFINFLE